MTQHPIDAKVNIYQQTDSTTTLLTPPTGKMDNKINLIFMSPPKGRLLLEIIPLKYVTVDGKTVSQESEDYEPQCVNLSLPDNAGASYDVAPVLLERKRAKKLDEITITASKIKFYYKGDTLVYNADAFILSEGSMLDALINQMPGVEMSDKGVITANGRTVESLLINGKDLFNGNNKLMIENLPAYTVRNIAIYNQQGRVSNLMGTKTGDEKYVMDVRLKRQYHHGGMGNANIGYGTHNRYLAKLFGLWFSDNVSVSVFGGSNNLSDAEIPGKQDGSWSTEKMGRGVETRSFGGVTYNATGSFERWSLKGDVSATSRNIDANTQISQTKFFNTGDIYRYAWQNSINKNVEVKTSYEFFTKLNKRAILQISPRLHWSKTDIKSNSVEASFDKEIKEITQNRILAIYADHTTPDSLINSEFSQSGTNGNSLDGEITAQSDIKLHEGSHRNMLTLEASVNYNHISKDYTNYYRLRFGNDTEESEQTALRLFKNRPDNKISYSASARFNQFFNYYLIQLPIKYQFTYTDYKKGSQLYTSTNPENQYTGSDNGLIDNPIYIDNDGSYWSREKSYKHKFGISPSNYMAMNISSTHSLSVMLQAYLSVINRDFIFRTGSGPTTKHRTELLPDVFAQLHFLNNNKHQWHYIVELNADARQAPMLAMVNLPSQAPLFSYLGNPDIKSTTNYSIDFSARRSTAGRLLHRFDIQHKRITNDVVQGIYYDLSTGHTTLRATNVNGNHSTRISYHLYLPFAKYFDLNSNTSLRNARNADFASSYNNHSEIDFSKTPSKTIIKSNAISEKVTINWQYKGHRISLLADIRWNDYHNRNNSLSDFQAWTAQYGGSAIVNLPHNWSVSTDMTLYTRRGFTDRRLNTTDFVWNARLSKSFMKGSIIIAADAYDILHQISNISYTVNAQARTETVANAIPAYVLVHAYYRFNFQPKK